MKSVESFGKRRYQVMIIYVMLFQPFLYNEIDIKSLPMLFFLLGTVLLIRRLNFLSEILQACYDQISIKSLTLEGILSYYVSSGLEALLAVTTMSF